MLAGIAIVLFTLSAPGSGTTPQKDAVMTQVRHFVESFNKGDTTAAATACQNDASIIDEFPPYEWHGAGACMKWIHAFGVNATKNHITDAVVTLHSPRHVDVTGGPAYIVVPADYAFRRKGKLIREIDSTLIIVRQKSGSGWKIVGWSWTKR